MVFLSQACLLPKNTLASCFLNAVLALLLRFSLDSFNNFDGSKCPTSARGQSGLSLQLDTWLHCFPIGFKAQLGPFLVLLH